MKDTEKSEKNALDAFWDIDSLLPKDHRRPKPVKRDTSAAEIIFSPAQKEPDGDRRGAIPARSDLSSAPPEQSGPAKAAEKVLFCYTPDHSLIRSVTLSTAGPGNNFYDKFLSDADKYLSASGSPCEFVPFFSYFPQHGKLSKKQLDYYLYFRDCVRRGEFPKTEMSYILLLVYEIINLPDRIPPEEGLRVMTDMWLSYRGEFSGLDKYLCEWVADYCLIHQLPPPTEKLDSVIKHLAGRCSFREFYLTDAKDDDPEASADVLASALVRFASSYNWRQSRAVTPENKALFRRHVPGALSYLLENAVLSGARPVLRTCSRTSYVGALCCAGVKRRIDVEYLSFDQSIELCAVVTAAVKYSENRIRAYCGIKARLRLSPLPDDISRCLCEYFDRELGAPVSRHGAAVQAEAVQPEYEKLYDPISSGFDLEKARQIESDSWTLTRLLEPDIDASDIADGGAVDGGTADVATEVVDQDDGVADAVGAACQDDGAAEEAGGYAGFVASLSEEEREFLLRVYRGEPHPPSILPDAVADAVNGKAVEFTADVILEDDGGGYAIIEDYLGELEGLLF